MDSSKSDKQELLETKTDMKLLLDCLDYQEDCPTAMRQALVTLSTILQGSDGARHMFHEAGGIQRVWDVTRHTNYDEVVEVGLYCLGSAVERNVSSQKLLTTASVFTFLHDILSSADSSVMQKQTATFLLLCLVSNNGFGQALARQSSCLHDIITLIRTTLPRSSRAGLSTVSEKDVNVSLWAALLNAAAVCVNNPLNEENQRICVVLLPYLLSVLPGLRDERTISPLLSLIGLTVANSVNNQERVRQCGGLEVFINKLKSLQRQLAEDSRHLPIVIHLISTLDYCIADNDISCKRMGCMGGIKLVMEILSKNRLDDQDKTQAMLTLAHAVEACDGNKKYISNGESMAMLIQMLTETDDVELSKTIKYLLHMCVSTDKSANSDDEHFHLPMDKRAAGMEQMKWNSDMEILKKINELDSKLQSMGKPVDNSCGNGTGQLMVAYEGDKSSNMTKHTQRQSITQVESLARSICSSGDVGVIDQLNCTSPQEKSLMQQLVKEKIERKRLEKLNQMLHEDICISRGSANINGLNTANLSACTRSGKIKDDYEVGCSLSLQNDQLLRDSSNHLPQESMARQTPIKAGICQERDGPIYSAGDESIWKGIRHSPSDVSGQLQVNGHNFHRTYNKPCSNTTLSCVQQNHRHKIRSACEPPVNQDTWKNGLMDKGCAIVSLERLDRHLVSTPLETSQSEWNDNEYIAVPLDLAVPRDLAVPLDLSTTSRPIISSSSDGIYPNQACSTQFGMPVDHMCSNADYPNVQKSGLNTDFRLHSAVDSSCEQSPSIQPGTTYNRNAEIQCGTPFVYRRDKESQNEESQANTSDNQNNRSTDVGQQKNTASKADVNSDSNQKMSSDITSPTKVDIRKLLHEHKRAVQNTSPIRSVFVKKGQKEVRPGNSVQNTSTSACGDMNENVASVKDLFPESRAVDNIHPACTGQSAISVNHADSISCATNAQGVGTISQVTDEDPHCRNVNARNKDKSNVVFLKPLAVPCKRKVRVTPKLGSGKIPRLKGIVSHDANQDSSSDLLSEFDVSLMKQVQKCQSQHQLGLTRKGVASAVIKSQNNVRQIDKHVQARDRNVADNWTVAPATPKLQQIRPVRPAFSDCGMRRHVLRSPFRGQHSSGNRKESRDDSGLCSPGQGCHEFSISPGGMSQDTDVDGCRSNSDVSDNGEEMIPNINKTVLRGQRRTKSYKNNFCPETDPGTCPAHRELRKAERKLIHQTKNQQAAIKDRRLLERKATFRRSQPEKSRKSVYEFPSDTDRPTVSSASSSEDELDCYLPRRRHKPRRERVPYSAAEEANIMEGVRKIGRFWNQILNTYKFHPSRTNVDLKDKYKRMMAAESRDTSSLATTARVFRPFSMCEERRLKRGVRQFGYNWKQILKSFLFARGRTTEDLRNRWRCMHQK